MPADVQLIASHWTLAGDVEVTSERLSPWPFAERVAVAAAAGYVGLGLNHAELCYLRQTTGFAEMRQVLDGHGLTIVELEGPTDWFADGDARRRSDVVRRDLLDAAEALGARHVKVSGAQGADQDVPGERMTEEFAGLCGDAEEAGTTVVIEMAPPGSVDTLDRAVELVQDAGAGNGGLLLDMWHVARSGTRLDEIAALPPGCLMHVEIDDGGPPSEQPPFEDAIRNRRLCGEGEFDIRGLYRAVREAGYHGPVGVEILSTSFRKLPLAEMARRSYDTAADVLGSA